MLSENNYETANIQNSIIARILGRLYCGDTSQTQLVMPTENNYRTEFNIKLLTTVTEKLIECQLLKNKKCTTQTRKRVYI